MNMKNWETKKIIDIAYVTDYVASGSFAKLKENGLCNKLSVKRVKSNSEVNHKYSRTFQMSNIFCLSPKLR